MSRREVDPCWDMGLGFGKRASKAAKLTLPWEQEAFSFLSDKESDSEVLSLLGHLEPVPLPSPATGSTLQPVAPQVPQPRLRPLGSMSQVDAQSSRQAALGRWSHIVRSAPYLFDVNIVNQVHSAVTSEELGNLDLIFAKKSTNTLLSRASSIHRFVIWALRHFPQEPLAEPLVFLYCKQEQKKRPVGSSVDQFVQALNFCQGTLGLAEPAGNLASSRVKGVAHQCLRKQKAPQQAQALTVSQVQCLERLARRDPKSYESLLAAGFLFKIYARARHSDVDRAVDLFFDFSRDGKEGFVECKVSNPKQTKAAARRNVLLPLVAPASGVGPEPWAEAFYATRKVWGLVLQGSLEGSPLLPEMTADGTLLPCNLSSATASRWLRALLAKEGMFEPENLYKLSSHSCKATCLSWVAKAAVNQLDRTLLGYHSLGSNVSTLSYSRDSLSGPLRELQKVLKSIQLDKFRPDETRSGRIVSDQPAQESTDSSSSSVTSSSEADEEQVIHGASHILALLAGQDDYQFLTNEASMVAHIFKLNSERLLCGRGIFDSLVVTPCLDLDKVRICHTCQVVAEGLLDGKWAKSPKCSRKQETWTVV